MAMVSVALCATGREAATCPIDPTPYVTVNGNKLDSKRVELPVGARFYVRLRFSAELPTFRLPHTRQLLPITVTPTALRNVVAVTLPFARGEAWLKYGDAEYREFIIVDRPHTTRHATRERLENYDRWSIDSDATWFRIETPDGATVEMTNQYLMLEPESTVIALYDDGTEDVIYRGQPPTEMPWWALGLALTGLGSVLLARRVSFVG